MKETDSIWIIERKKYQQSVWTIILMVVEKVWNKIMFIFCVGVGKYKRYEIGRSQPSIKEKEEWRRQFSALNIDEDNDEVKVIAEMMVRQVKSWRIGHQFDQMREEYIQGVKDNKFVTKYGAMKIWQYPYKN